MRQRSAPRSGDGSIGDADVAAGSSFPGETPPLSVGTTGSLEIFDELVSEPVLVLGLDISHFSRRAQFVTCASGVFCFSLLYGFLQELLSVHLCNRQLGLFMATMQFTGYTLFSFVLRTYVYEPAHKKQLLLTEESQNGKLPTRKGVPFRMYLGLSFLRAVDLAMTNLAMQYINYPAKTLMKSCRVVFTMLFGVVIGKKRYTFVDYAVVLCMVSGLALFMHADAHSSAVFQPIGVFMLMISLICDGAISNMSETIMNQYGVGQDEFIFRMYSIALVAISAAAYFKGDLQEGLVWMTRPGTYGQTVTGEEEERVWSVAGKFGVMVLFSCMGFFGSSCSAAITKNFGALTMSITSTARKATTLFLSFLIFDNACTLEHICGIFVFITALTTKSLRTRKHGHKQHKEPPLRVFTSNHEPPRLYHVV